MMQQEAEILQLALKVPGGSVNSAIAKYLCWVAAFYLDFHGIKSTGLFRSHTCAPDPSHPWKKKSDWSHGRRNHKAEREVISLRTEDLIVLISVGDFQAISEPQ